MSDDSMETLSRLIEKRHEGDGWFVFSELADRPGYYAKRFADHAALGLWGSTHHEFHLYETKISREDVKREMRDPSKVEGVGKYAHYWWLVVSDLKIIEDVAIPDCWGILAPVTRGGSRLLKVHRKAPKRKPVAFSPMFCVSLIRNMGKNWVKPAKHRELEEKLYRLEHPAFERAADNSPTLEEERDELQRKLARLEESIAAFEKITGVDLAGVREGRYHVAPIARAVKIALELEGHDGARRLRDQIEALASAADEGLQRAVSAAHGVATLRALAAAAGGVEHSGRCRKNHAIDPSRQWCSCGAEMSEVEATLAEHVRIRRELRTPPVPPPLPPDGDDHPGSAGHRGGAGQDQQDAGGVVRDQRAEVPHG